MAITSRTARSSTGSRTRSRRNGLPVSATRFFVEGVFDAGDGVALEPDDARKLPVQIRVRLQLAIGTITLQLEKEEKT